MKKPSDNLRIKVALDTQILAYLVDNTYPNLNFFIRVLSESPFVDIVCSRFAIYEFIGIRKLEHYLRCLVNETEKKGGQVNFSSALKYRNEFDTPELKYIDAYENVKKAVEEDLIKIDSDFGVMYESVDIHNGLWKPHQELVLSTRISKEDSLLLLSSVFPEPLRKEEYLVLLTNDNQFYNALCGVKEIETSNNVFENNGLIKPRTYYLKNLTLKEADNVLNLVDYNFHLTDEDINDYSTKFIAEHIKEKNKSILLGEVINCACSKELKKKLLCFRLQEEQELVANTYITILTKDFTLYNHPVPLSNFKCHGDITLLYRSNDNKKSKEISIELVDGNGEILNETLMENITSTGNLVFIHPDSFI